MHSLAVPQNIKATIWPNKSTPGYLPKRNENIYPPKTHTQLFIAVLLIKKKKAQK